MAIHAKIVEQICSYRPVADELVNALDLIQNAWKYKVISVYETKVNKSPNCSDQGFVILYDDLKTCSETNKAEED